MDHIARRLVFFSTVTIGMLALAACGGDEPAPTTTPAAQSTPTPGVTAPAAGDPDIAFTLLPIIHIGAFIDPSDTVGADPNPTLRVFLGSIVQVTLQNHGDGEFDIYFPDFEAKSERVAGGSTTSIVFVADKEGEFPYYSTVPGHREVGLEGRIVVTAAP